MKYRINILRLCVLIFGFPFVAYSQFEFAVPDYKPVSNISDPNLVGLIHISKENFQALDNFYIGDDGIYCLSGKLQSATLAEISVKFSCPPQFRVYPVLANKLLFLYEENVNRKQEIKALELRLKDQALEISGLLQNVKELKAMLEQKK